MITAHFHKKYAQSVIDALSNHRPIPVPKGGWSCNNLLTLAGILSGGAYAQGPAAYQPRGLSREVMDQLPTERQEAINETFQSDIQISMGFINEVLFTMLNGDYDSEYEPEVEAVLYREPDEPPMSMHVVCVKGFKNGPPPEAERN